MKYIVYLTTNKKSKINGLNRIYVGVHQTKDPNVFDGYLGDSVRINQPSTYKYPKTPFQYAVKKYGVSAFERVTLFVFNTAKEAYAKEREIVNEEFINQSHTYNTFEEKIETLYQFDYNGNLIKEWKNVLECCEFYGYPLLRWSNAIKHKCSFLNSYWATSSTIDINTFSNKSITNIVYLYNKDGKLLRGFITSLECANYLNCDVKELSNFIKCQMLFKNKYLISNTITDQFIPKPRKRYINQTFYVYTVQNEFLGKYKGKELMKVIGTHSWRVINNIFTKNRNWYKNFYVTLEPIERVPSKVQEIHIDVYDKFGNFIETVSSIKEIKEKYNVPSGKIKNIQLGDRYFGEYVFKYNSK